jgi:hypothetical protein
MSKKIFNDDFFGKFRRSEDPKMPGADPEKDEDEVAVGAEDPPSRPRFSTLHKQIQDGKRFFQIPDRAGPMQTDSAEPKISFRPAPSQRVISKRSSYIVFGKDRPCQLPSGYGGKGALGADAIDIVVGRMSSLPKVNTRKRPRIVNSHFGADAARIYISQLTDIDTNFAIADGVIGNIKARSGIGIKADVVRIVGREGIKIVTGKGEFPGFGSSGEPNSLGGKIIQPSPTIELIAGNYDGPRTVFGGMFLPRESINSLQPVVAGDNLNSALKDLNGIIEKIMSAIFNLAVIQSAFNAAIGVNLWPANSPHYGAAGGASATQIIDMVINNIWQTRINANLWENNYCTPYGYKYICSRNVFAT